MSWFTHLPRRREDTKRDVRQHQRAVAATTYGAGSLPRGFDVLTERMILGGDLEGVAIQIGEATAAAGTPLHEVLGGLEQAFDDIRQTSPPYAVTKALVTGWTESSLQYLHAMSCEDPLTGLASLPHVRSRLSEIYRTCENDGMRPETEYAMLVVELPRISGEAMPLWGGLKLLEVAELMRTVFSGGETMGRAGTHRVIVVVERDESLGGSVSMAQELLTSGPAASQPATMPRVWVEGLPPASSAASLLLDELAR